MNTLELLKITEPNVFIYAGDFWFVRFGDEWADVRDVAGMSDLRFLLQWAGRTFSTVEFLQLRERRQIHLDPGDEIISQRDYHRLVAELGKIDEAIIQAQGGGLVDLVDDLKTQQNKINDYLRTSLKFNGKPRKLGSHLDSERKRLGENLNRAMKHIGRHLCLLAGHLDGSIACYSGLSLGYTPSTEVEWYFEPENIIENKLFATEKVASCHKENGAVKIDDKLLR